MGTILFYIFEATLCLTILYFLFRLFFRKDTLFRTNRYLLLMGTVACTLLPLLQINVPQYTTLQLPITAVRHLLTEKEVNIERKKYYQRFQIYFHKKQLSISEKLYALS